MPTVLLGLGSNLGDSQVTLDAALLEIAALPDVQVVRQSSWHRTRPIGGPANQADYLNGAATIETKIAPLTLLAELQRIETRHGRVRTERWAPRTLDIDLLLYGSEVAESPMLILPHPRMTYREFVLQPVVEIAPRMLHPTIGWPTEQLLVHLQAASDHLAILSPSEPLRSQLGDRLTEQRGAHRMDRPKFATADHHWPPLCTTWLEFSPRKGERPQQNASDAPLPYGAAAFPKLSVLLDADVAHRGADKLQWSTLVRQPGRGPTLRLQTTDPQEIEAELLAAVDAVWA
jgi:2-amino-4-hydroxy-6-hydroxymethyldihydropteridine diphosphokinase